MNYYSAKEIKEKLTCEEYVRQQGHEFVHGRCAAWWRGGVNKQSVAINERGWFDHVMNHGGSVIDLCAIVECGDIGNTFKAMQVLGERMHLEPLVKMKKAHKTRSEILIEKGYKATATYDYVDEDGVVKYSVVRFEKDEYGPDEHKEFIHKTPDHEGLDKDTKKLLYNLPAVIHAQEVFVVEGEKDANTLISFGLCATTNSGGASNWDRDFNRYFAGKDVVIISDNDEPGQKHGRLLAGVLKPVAKSVKSLTISSLPKGDVTDWVEKEGGSAQKLREIVDGVRESVADDPEIAAAKLANEVAFTNFKSQEVSTGRGRKSVEELPLSMNEILSDVNVRFLGFPRNLGSVLFDWSRATKQVMLIDNVDALFAWIQRISGKNVAWNQGNGYVTQRQLFEGLRQDGVKYMGLSNSPHYPARKDVFYTHDPFPPPDPTHTLFWELIDFFNPSDAENRILIAAMFVAPIYYSKTAKRPMWIVDTDDAQGSGKTTLVNMVAHLYGHAPLPIDIQQLDRDSDQITKRLISSEGRQARIVLLDNVIGTLKSPNLASLVTDTVISGRPAYGRGEETRPNDITYIATVNGAQVDTDIATRCYTVRIRAPENPKPSWEHEVFDYIERNRPQIFADILHMVRNNPNAKLMRRKSRFGMFDSVVLSSVCKGADEFNSVDAVLSNAASSANEDNDRAQEFSELFMDRTSSIGVEMVSGCVFILGRDVDYILSHSDGALSKWTQQNVIQLAKQGRLPSFDKHVFQIPHNSVGIPRQRGLLFRTSMEGGDTVMRILHRRGNTFYFDGEIPFHLDPIM